MFRPSAASLRPPPLAAAEGTSLARRPAAGPPAGAVPLARGPGPRSWRLPQWDRLSNPERIAVISRTAKEAADDPRLRRAAVRIFRRAGVASRDYIGQAEAILRAMQEQCYFVNEQGEVLQDPAYTLDLRDDGTIGPDAAGDCDDQAGAVAALCRSVHLPVRLVTSGRHRGQAIRWIEGQKGPLPVGVEWGHIYDQIGNHPFRPDEWNFADATVPGAPLGWDVVGARGADPQRDLPSFGDARGADAPAGMTFRTAAALVGVSVAANVLIKQLERRGWI